MRQKKAYTHLLKLLREELHRQQVSDADLARRWRTSPEAINKIFDEQGASLSAERLLDLVSFLHFPLYLKGEGRKLKMYAHVRPRITSSKN
jgi:hypothetical protein